MCMKRKYIIHRSDPVMWEFAGGAAHSDAAAGGGEWGAAGAANNDDDYRVVIDLDSD